MAQHHRPTEARDDRCTGGGRYHSAVEIAARDRVAKYSQQESTLPGAVRGQELFDIAGCFQGILASARADTGSIADPAWDGVPAYAHGYRERGKPFAGARRWSYPGDVGALLAGSNQGAGNRPIVSRGVGAGTGRRSPWPDTLSLALEGFDRIDHRSLVSRGASPVFESRSQRFAVLAPYLGRGQRAVQPRADRAVLQAKDNRRSQAANWYGRHFSCPPSPSHCRSADRFEPGVAGGRGIVWANTVESEGDRRWFRDRPFADFPTRSAPGRIPAFRGYCLIQAHAGRPGGPARRSGCGDDRRSHTRAIG